jgi:RimJ/RimL family protein N-acetyltransferase
MDVIETERLRLRPLSTADVVAWVALHADEQVSRFVGSYTPERAMERLRLVEQQWAERGHGLFAIEDRTTGELLGRGGLQYWDQFGEVEAGWTLSARSWGRGYAAEAARSFIGWGWARLDPAYIIAMIHPGNDSSARLAGRLGFTPRRVYELDGRQVDVYVLDRPEGTPQ